jgi:hypothetical protein
MTSPPPLLWIIKGIYEYEISGENKEHAIQFSGGGEEAYVGI